MKLSAAIVTLNEEERLPRALRSLDFCDEILVVDSGSTDRTVEIARAAGARVETRSWPGYAAQKNAAASLASHDWILSLDADEELSPELRAEIESLHAGGDPPFRAYSFPRRARYLGRWIRASGWYPDRKIRLYDRRAARWEGDYVHEAVRADGPVGRLEGDLLHYTCDSIEEHLRTLNRYTSLAAAEQRARGRRPVWTNLTLSPLWAFWRTWLFRGGFRDGFPGFIIAVTAAFYVFTKYAKAREQA